MGSSLNVLRCGIVLAAAIAWSGSSVSLWGQEAEKTSSTKEVAAELIASGAELFKDDAGCKMCHGPEGKGVSGMTSDLTDGEWRFAEGGTLESLASVIKTGISAEKAGGKLAMPKTKLTDTQVEALAAYVWSLSQGKKAEKGE